jgi:hypothetical protein
MDHLLEIAHLPDKTEVCRADPRLEPSLSDAALGSSRRSDRRFVFALLSIQIILLFIVGYRNRYYNDMDGTAYVRIAHYYATGKSHLMISGYWGPLLSWLMVPWLWLGMSPFDAARISMGLSVIAFQFGCLSVFNAFGMVAAWRRVALVLSALAGVVWSVCFSISPDLLVSGLMCYAISRLVDPNWLNERKAAFFAGCVWGVAYLAKAVAFPFAIAISLGFAILFFLIGTAALGRIIRQLTVTLVAFALIVSPWVTALSFKYQRFTFSESARISHTTLGPRDIDRDHPIGRIIFRPEAGRISAWEDPSRMPYRYWSPFENRAYAIHQVKHITKNFWTIWCCLSDLDFLTLGLVAAFAGLLFRRNTWRERLRRQKWRWALVPIIAIIGLYLPVFADAPRYFYATFPMFLIMVAGAQQSLAERFSTQSRFVKKAVLVLAILSFGIPSLGRLPQVTKGLSHEPFSNARILAQKLQTAGLTGPLIGNPPLFAVDWVGLLTEQPWYGADPAGTPDTYRHSGARLLVIRRTLIRSRFADDPDFQDLDTVLFASQAEANQFPVKVFGIASH